MNIVRISRNLIKIIDSIDANHLSTSVSEFPEFVVFNSQYGFDFVDLSPTQKGRLSAMAKNQGMESPPSDEVRAERGTFIKVGKLLRALFPESNQQYLASLGCQLGKELTSATCGDIEGEFTLSDDVGGVYNMEHPGNDSSLGGSCMRECDKRWFQLYEDLGCKVLYMEDDEGVLRGRAIVWYENIHRIDDPRKTPITLMDRIYVAGDNDEVLFKRYAREHGWYYKQRQNYSTPDDLVNPNGEPVRQGVRTLKKLQDSAYAGVPFLDSICYLDGNNYLTTCSMDSRTKLQETGGCDYNNILVRRHIAGCAHCSIRIYSGDDYVTFSGGTLCQSCYDDHYYTCEHCDEIIHNEYAGNYEVDGVEIVVCDRCRDNDLAECTHCSRYFTDSLESVNGEGYCDTCIGDLLKEGTMEKCERHDDIIFLVEEGCPDCEEEERKILWYKDFKARVSPGRILNSDGEKYLVGLSVIEFSHSAEGGIETAYVIKQKDGRLSAIKPFGGVDDKVRMLEDGWYYGCTTPLKGDDLLTIEKLIESGESVAEISVADFYRLIVSAA